MNPIQCQNQKSPCIHRDNIRD